MNDSLKKVLAVLIIIAIVFSWYITLKGIPGVMDPVKDKLQLGLDIKGGVYVVLEAQGTEELSEAERKDLMDRTQAVIERRVDAMGLTNPNVAIEGGNRIRIELPGAEDAEEAIEQIGKTAQLKFTLADQSFVLDGGSVKDATVGQDTQRGGYVVNLEFDQEGAEAFEKATTTTAAGGVPSTMVDGYGQQVPGNAIVISLDNEIISAPTAETVISGGKCEISGNFTQESATNLAALIRGGALPVDLREVTSSSQTAKIGIDALTNSVNAGIIGAIIIFLIMLIGYRIMGVVANIALTLYIALILIIMSIMGSVLTLPGIAGIILSIGMAVDANVVIFTRIREEIVGGKSIRVATRTGYKLAMSTVIDSQVTTLIAAVILYQMGTSAVKGFAWTLMIGIIISIFTAVVVTQLYLSLIAGSETFAKNAYFGINKDGDSVFRIKRQFRFVTHRKIYYIISIVIIVAGLLVGGIRGFNYGIDFTGGTMLHMDMGRQVSTQEVKEVLKSHGINTDQSEIVYSGKGNEEVIIKTNESLNGPERTAITDDFRERFGIAGEDVLASEHFGASVGKELKGNAVKAVLLSAAGMLIYIRLRFRQWKFGAAALLGTLHDVLILVAFYAIFHITVNNPFIAAVLTVVGYSINDTIVIFDRIRENMKFMRRGGTEEIIDKSINQTLSRSIMTSFTTLIVMVPLYIMAGDVIREFVVPLMVGVATGCLSSIYISSPLYYDFSRRGSVTRYEKQVAMSKKKGPAIAERKKAQEEIAVEDGTAAGSEVADIDKGASEDKAKTVNHPKGSKKQPRKARRKKK